MEKQKLVKQTVEMHEQMNALTPDVIATAPVVETAPQTKIARRERDDDGCPYIYPKRKIKGLGVLPENMRKKHDHDWEYVKGIFENNVIIGEGIEFWFQVYPGDDNCLWSIPANRPVWVPRMVAKHLETKMVYHKFAFKNKEPSRIRPDDYMEEFVVSDTVSRGKFRPIGAFN